MTWSPLGPQNIPFYSGFGVETPFGILLPPGSKVAAYVRSGGVSTQDAPEIQSRLVKTLSSALSYVRAGRGDTVILLPGHTENVTDNAMLANLVAGTRIVGVGHSSIRPTFTWTATGSQWILNKSGVTIEGIALHMDGANGVVKAIDVTSYDVAIRGCVIRVASGAALKATIAMELGASAGGFELSGCRIRGTASHNMTNGILISGTANSTRIVGNDIQASATAGNGLIRVTGAATELLIAHNYIYNTHTSSTACISFADVASDGIVAYNALATLSTGASTSGTEGIAFTGTGSFVKCFQNFVANDPRTSGELLPTADT